jgi:hypothetical protein
MLGFFRTDVSRRGREELRTRAEPARYALVSVGPMACVGPMSGRRS